MKVTLSWTDFKALCATKGLNMQYTETPTEYSVWASENGDRYKAVIERGDSDPDETDFDTNYKSVCNQAIHPLSDDKKLIVRSESRPLNCTTVFTGVADNIGIGDGKVLTWDFSNTNDDVTPPTNYKRKRLEFSFIDTIYIKEGGIYYHNVQKGSYIDFYVVCPAGEYYIDNAGNTQLAGVDTVVNHFTIHHPMQGTVPMGDELNTESCSNAIPSTYKFWIEITVPDTDSSSNGALSLELYRSRTAVL